MNFPYLRVFCVVALLGFAASACGTESSPTTPSTPEQTEMTMADTSTDMSMTSEQEMTPDEHTLAFGEPADPGDADRVIEIETLDTLRFEPESLDIGVGEMITFRVTNNGNLPHDFTLADENGQEDHEAEMAAMAASGGMMMDDPNAFAIAPGETKELTWIFEEPGEVLIGCHQPGHYAAGMRAVIAVAG